MGQFDGQVVYITGIARGQVATTPCDSLPRVRRSSAWTSRRGWPTTRPTPTATEDDLAETVRLVEEAGGKILARKGDTRDLAFPGAARRRRVSSCLAASTMSSPTPESLTWGLTWGADRRAVHRRNRREPRRHLEDLEGHDPDDAQGPQRRLHHHHLLDRRTQGDAQPGVVLASKFALRGLAQSVAKELGPKHIRVNTVHLYAVHTPMGVEDTSAFKSFEDWPEHFPSMMNHYPIASVDDLSDAVLYLAGAKAVTGAEFAIDMGSSKV